MIIFSVWIQFSWYKFLKFFQHAFWFAKLSTVHQPPYMYNINTFLFVGISSSWKDIIFSLLISVTSLVNFYCKPSFKVTEFDIIGWWVDFSWVSAFTDATPPTDHNYMSILWNVLIAWINNIMYLVTIRILIKLSTLKTDCIRKKSYCFKFSFDERHSYYKLINTWS